MLVFHSSMSLLLSELLFFLSLIFPHWMKLLFPIMWYSLSCCRWKQCILCCLYLQFCSCCHQEKEKQILRTTIKLKSTIFLLMIDIHLKLISINILSQLNVDTYDNWFASYCPFCSAWHIFKSFKKSIFQYQLSLYFNNKSLRL